LRFKKPYVCLVVVAPCAAQRSWDVLQDQRHGFV